MNDKTQRWILLGIIFLLVIVAVRAIGGNRPSSTLGAASKTAKRSTEGD